MSGHRRQVCLFVWNYLFWQRTDRFFGNPFGYAGINLISDYLDVYIKVIYIYIYTSQILSTYFKLNSIYTQKNCYHYGGETFLFHQKSIFLLCSKQCANQRSPTRNNQTFHGYYDGAKKSPQKFNN